MPGERRPAIGVIRPELLRGKQIDLASIAGPDFRLVFTVFLDAGPMLTALAIARHLDEFTAAAVVTPGLEHVDPVRHVVTDLAALVTPSRVYPRGYRWPEREDE